MEKEFEKYCEMLSAGTASCREVSYRIDNMFYERFGMSYDEILKKLYNRLY